MRRCVLILGVLSLLATAKFATGDEPLHEQIDKLVAQKFDGRQPAALADDASFLRRIWLDLAGRIPTAEEARRFLDDKSADKRTKLIDRLLDAPTYAPHMEDRFHVLLMERRSDNPDWRKFLAACFEKNLPWDEMVRHVLAPDDQDDAMRGAAHFYTERLKSYGANPVDFPGLTRDVGRLFLGVDLQCAECHNHLFIDDYDQREFQGLFAIYKNLSIRREKFPAVSEKAITEKLKFVSVFDPTERETGPRVPFGTELAMPEAPAADEKGDKKKDQGPQSAALKWLAGNLPTGGNELFAKNIVNRLWFLMMGRGLVEPLDQFHSDNPPSHPELLDLLAREFVAHKFDIKWMMRELALSETFQRSSIVPEGQQPPAPQTYLVALERPVSAEQLLASTLAATGNDATAAEDDLKDRYLKAFANEPREPEIEFAPSVKAALFMLNDDKVLELLRPQPGNLVERLSKISDPKQRVDELFLSIFTRLPTDAEREAVDSYLAENADRLPVALGHVAWGMISSIEFCIKH